MKQQNNLKLNWEQGDNCKYVELNQGLFYFNICDNEEYTLSYNYTVNEPETYVCDVKNLQDAELEINNITNVMLIMEKEIITELELEQLQECEYLTYEYNSNNYLHQNCYCYTFTFIDGQEWDCYTPKEQKETQEENDVQNTKQEQKQIKKTIFDYWDGDEWITVPLEIIQTWFNFTIDYNSIVNIKECAGVDKLEINTIDDTIYCKKDLNGKYSEPTVIR